MVAALLLAYATLSTFGVGPALAAPKGFPCHTIGKGDGLGPDLLGVTTRRDPAWLARYVAVPDKMRAEHDPIVPSQ